MTSHTQTSPMPAFFALQGTLKDYDWGSVTLLADLQSREPTGRPEAEMWFGTHPSGISAVHIDEHDLNPFDSAPQGQEHPTVPLTEITGELGFLTKLLAAAQPLSLQAHPNQQQAREGFARENAAGIALSDPRRCFQDDQHKPEMLIALTHFVALCGFRDPVQASYSFQRLAEAEAEHHEQVTTDLSAALARISLLLSGGNIRQALHLLLDPSGPWVDPESGWVERVIQVIHHAEQLRRDDQSLDTAALAADFFPRDPGVLVTLLMNRVQLAPGQAIFLAAQQLHAYVEGLGLEVMAASNNVVRGGLTNKHIDRDQLDTLLDYAPVGEPLVYPRDERANTDLATGITLSSLCPPVEEFCVLRADFETENLSLTLDPATVLVPDLAQPVILVCTAGSVVLSSGTRQLELNPGQAAVLPHASASHAAGAPVSMVAQSANSTVFATGVPTARS
ncbi:mannose-6-phosphate isomerase, class I [Auritidibacter ignavus]|uniref:mannose-6-phosphate isomerase, class I n=1 Tax=Auritidibacter ignavus TaxID=678932 RepID=UPI0024BBE00B|nr:mannose-6-phosphate isomerase, class I [Auritidibacter ignavus]WHS27353.1 mannose-6-phosphate isomerase, class I [Auritidibacter ignavus]